MMTARRLVRLLVPSLLPFLLLLLLFESGTTFTRPPLFSRRRVGRKPSVLVNDPQSGTSRRIWFATTGSDPSQHEEDGGKQDGVADRLLQMIKVHLASEEPLSSAEMEKLRQARTLLHDLLEANEAPPTSEGPPPGKVTYAAAGVDVEKGDRFVDIIKGIAHTSWRPGVMGGIGGFGAIFNLTAASIPPDALLVASTDGVGTKVLLAREREDYETLGWDLVAMSTNDVLTMGAEPLFFLDYMGWPQLDDLSHVTSTLQGIAAGCRASGCALIGGETAELPGVYLPDGGRDLAGFVVGAVSPMHLLPQKHRICSGDVIVGLPSNGLHANGLSLVRRLVQDDPSLDYESPPPFLDDDGTTTTTTLRQSIMRPTRIYVSTLLPILKRRPGLIKAMAHITGGGLTGNLPRVLPAGLSADLKWGSWTVPSIFRWLQARSGLSMQEMGGVFNCGIGMCVIVAKDDCDELLHELGGGGVVIGAVTGATAVSRLSEYAKSDTQQKPSVF